jgi:hypothetical protein
MTIPYTFANQTGPIPLSELDSNFTTLSSSSNISYTEGGTSAVTTTVQSKLQQTISVKDFGAAGDGSTDDSAAIIAANTAAVAAGAILYFPAGTYKCQALTLNDIKVDGIILSTSSTNGNAVILDGSIDAPLDNQIFSYSATAPTNLPGTTVPFKFGSTCIFGSPVSVKWFGAKGDNTTDDTNAINACSTAMSFGIAGGTPYAPLRGPIEMFFPRGNYVIAGTINVANGTLMRGEESGSNPLSTLIRDEITLGSASAADMIWMVKDNQNYTGNATQAFYENLSFVWRPASDFGSSTLQFQTAFIAFKAAAISVKVRNCWFLGSPQKGSIFSWGNDYVENGSGTGIVKVNTGSDSDGIDVDMSVFDTWTDVTYGTFANVFDKGYGAIQIYNTYMYQLWMGFASNYSTNTTGRLLFSIDGGTLYGVNIQNAPTYPVPSTGANSTTVWKELRNMDIFLNNLQIYSRNMSSLNFCFTNYLVNSNMRMTACYVDSAVDALYATQMWKLDWQVNSLILIGNEFYGPMTPNPSTITAPWPKAMISKLTGAATVADGITSILYLDSNKIDVGTMSYFIDKETAYSQISNFYCCNNYINITSSQFAFNTTGVPRYLMANNAWAATANSLETIP